MANGIVIINYSRQVVVEDETGHRHDCLVKGRRLQPVCGDRVVWSVQADGVNVIDEILPRRSLLYRYDVRRQQQPLAANLDQLLIITAVEPTLEPFLLDKYLVAAEALGIQPVIVLNKIDLLTDAQHEKLRTTLQPYATLGYPLLELSASTRAGLEGLKAALQNRSSALVGASGTGKSSIAAALLGDVAIRTGAISTARGEGRHTTTTTTLYHLPDGGDLIDSPGVRDFMLWPMPVTELKQHFVEFREPAARCRFNDCIHLNEPSCAVRAALLNGAISQQRYDSYQGLVKIMQAQYQAY